MKKTAVFCGSSAGFDPLYAKTAFKLGSILAERKISVVFGGGQVGLMGEVANGALSQNGEVIGVIPHFLNEKEIAHEGITEMITVNSMHERKMKINNIIDSVIVLSGGYGTLDEMFEMLTWGQLGLHQKPIGLLNIKCYFDPLLNMIGDMVLQGFLKESNQEMLIVDENPIRLLDKMRKYKAPDVKKWIKNDQM